MLAQTACATAQFNNKGRLIRRAAFYANREHSKLIHLPRFRRTDRFNCEERELSNDTVPIPEKTNLNLSLAQATALTAAGRLGQFLSISLFLPGLVCLLSTRGVPSGGIAIQEGAGVILIVAGCGLFWVGAMTRRGKKTATIILNLVTAALLLWVVLDYKSVITEVNRSDANDELRHSVGLAPVNHSPIPGWGILAIAAVPFLCTMLALFIVFGGCGPPRYRKKSFAKAPVPGRWSRRVGYRAARVGSGILISTGASSVLLVGFVMSALEVRGGLFAILLIGGLFFFVGGRLHVLAKRLRAASVAELRESDTRAPLLLLRSFKDDLTRMRGWLSYVLPGLGKVLTLEEIITDLLWQYGPVIAIGRPGEPLPPPGAAREYVPEAQWQERVTQYIGEARFIVVILGRTTGLAWEYTRLVQMGYLGRMLLVLPPDKKDAEARWNYFVEATGLRLTPIPLPNTVKDSLLVTFKVTREVFAATPHFVCSSVRNKRAYEAAVNCDHTETFARLSVGLQPLQ